MNHILTNLIDRIYDYRNSIFYFIALILFTIPFIWSGQLVFTGGDNSQLFFIMPCSMLDNYLFNVISDNGLGSIGLYTQQSYQAPFFYLLCGFDKALPQFVNLQSLFLGANLSLSFIGFYWFLGLWLDKNNSTLCWIRIISALVYCLSLFTFSTMWKHLLYSVYLLSLFPIILYLFFQGVREKNISYLIIGSITATLFSVALFGIPWLFGTLVIMLPLLIFHQYKYSNTLSYSLLFLLLVVLLNIFWLQTFVHSLLVPSVFSNAIQNPESNLHIIKEVTSQNNIFYPLTGSPMPRWIQEIDAGINMKVTFLLSLIIGLGAILRSKKSKYRNVFIVSTLCWLIGIYLYTVKIDTWGIDFFSFLNSYIPGFTMFRNNFDKFSIGIAFAFAFALSISLAIISETSFKYIRSNFRLLIISLFLITATLLWPAYKGQFNNPLWTTKYIQNTIHEFNSDFVDLVNFLQEEPSEYRYLWMPLNSSSYIIIADASLNGHYYIGTSPLRFLSDKTDLTGRFSFGSQNIGDKLFDKILNNDIDEIGLLLRNLNIGYIIINNDISRELANSYLHSVNNPGDLYDIQMKLILPGLVDSHIRDFGSRYSLYKIKQQYSQQKIYLNDYIRGSSVRSFLDWEKISSSEYKIKVNNINDSIVLSFAEPFHPGWKLFSDSGIEITNFPLAQEYSNSWLINTDIITNSMKTEDYSIDDDGYVSLSLTLAFKPEQWTMYGFIISIITFISCVLYLVLRLIFPVRN